MLPLFFSCSFLGIGVAGGDTSSSRVIITPTAMPSLPSGWVMSVLGTIGAAAPGLVRRSSQRNRPPQSVVVISRVFPSARARSSTGQREERAVWVVVSVRESVVLKRKILRGHKIQNPRESLLQALSRPARGISTPWKGKYSDFFVSPPLIRLLRNIQALLKHGCFHAAES